MKITLNFKLAVDSVLYTNTNMENQVYSDTDP